MEYDFLEKGVSEIIDSESLKKRLESGKNLRIKMGVDPTRPDLHLGHAVGMRILRQFQLLGHTIVFIIGDYTTKIGDPSGRNITRPVLSDEEIARNAKTYFEQASKILDIEKTEIRYNSEWFKDMNFDDILRVAGKFTVAQLIERDDFAKRLKEGSEIGLHELLYPVMQAYDSVLVKSDVELGGTEQKFNILAGRSLQKKMGQEPQEAIFVDLLVGLDGKEKMSKSLGNYVGITEPPQEMYGKIMSIPDSLIENYFILCTDVPKNDVEKYLQQIRDGENPKNIKEILASEIVTLYYNEKDALLAQEEFRKVFSRKELPTEMKDIDVKGEINIQDIVSTTNVFKSKSEIRRKIEEGAVKINSVKITDINQVLEIKSDDIIQIGKHNYFKVK